MEKSSGLISFAQGWTFIRFHFTQSSLSFMAYMLSLSVCHGSSCAAASLCVVLRVIFNQVKLMKGLGAKFWYVWLFCPRYFSIKIFGWDFNQKIQRFWSFTNYWFWQKLQKNHAHKGKSPIFVQKSDFLGKVTKSPIWIIALKTKLF